MIAIDVGHDTRVLFIIRSYQIQLLSFVSCRKFMAIWFDPIVFGCIAAVGVRLAVEVERSLEGFSGELKFELRELDRTAVVMPENLLQRTLPTITLFFSQWSTSIFSCQFSGQSIDESFEHLLLFLFIVFQISVERMQIDGELIGERSVHLQADVDESGEIVNKTVHMNNIAVSIINKWQANTHYFYCLHIYLHYQFYLLLSHILFITIALNWLYHNRVLFDRLQKTEFHNMTLINKLNKIDKKISKIIHELDHTLPTFILYPFAAFFHPGLIWVAYLLIYYFSNFDLRFTALYALSTLVCVILTTLLKKVAKRSRPELNTAVSKFQHFRKKQKNNAMPSGDAFQSAAFITFLSIFGLNPLYLILFHIGVCVGRVYYMCHWVADTVVATVIGTLVAKLMLSFEGSQFLLLLPQTLL